MNEKTENVKEIINFADYLITDNATQDKDTIEEIEGLLIQALATIHNAKGIKQ